MKFVILALSFAAGLALAQDDLSDGVPKCAGSCVLEYTTGGKIAGCAALEIDCICKNKDFLSGIACCLESACDQSGKDAAVKYAQQICGSAGVDVPDKVVCATGASSAAGASSTAASKSSTGSASKTAGSNALTASEASETGSSPSQTTGEPTGATAASATNPGAAAVLDAAGSLVGAAVAMLFAL